MVESSNQVQFVERMNIYNNHLRNFYSMELYNGPVAY